MPFLSSLTKVAHHCEKVIVPGRKNLDKVLKVWHRGEWADIHPEILFSALPQLLRGNLALLPF